MHALMHKKEVPMIIVTGPVEFFFWIFGATAVGGVAGYVVAKTNEEKDEEKKPA
jgi:hypothetical protein